MKTNQDEPFDKRIVMEISTDCEGNEITSVSSNNLSPFERTEDVTNIKHTTSVQ